jgi:hypothetical protein
MSPTHNSIYNFIVTTPDRCEFLLELKDYSRGSTTGDFLADQVSSIYNRKSWLGKICSICN